MTTPHSVIGKILSGKVRRDGWSRNKKALMLLSQDDEESEKIGIRSGIIDTKTITTGVEIPYIHEGGSVLDVYGRRKKR